MKTTEFEARRAPIEGSKGGIERLGAGDDGVPASTPTGIAITHCEACSISHAVSRSHCAVCGSASMFTRAGRCLAHAPEVLA